MRAEGELFTVLVTGKGVRLKARVPGWVAALVFSFAKENEAQPPLARDPEWPALPQEC